MNKILLFIILFTTISCARQNVHEERDIITVSKIINYESGAAKVIGTYVPDAQEINEIKSFEKDRAYFRTWTARCFSPGIRVNHTIGSGAYICTGCKKYGVIKSDSKIEIFELSGKAADYFDEKYKIWFREQ